MASDPSTGLAAIRAGLARNLTDALRPAGFEGTISPYQLSSMNSPQIEIGKGRTDYDEEMQRGGDFVVMIARIYIGYQLDEEAQALLDTFLEPLGPLSLKAALELDRTLAGACDDLIVRGDSGHQMYGSDASSGGAGELLGSELTIEVYT